MAWDELMENLDFTKYGRNVFSILSFILYWLSKKISYFSFFTFVEFRLNRIQKYFPGNFWQLPSSWVYVEKQFSCYTMDKNTAKFTNDWPPKTIVSCAP